MPRLGWFRRLRGTQGEPDRLLQGCLELITPSLLAGWVFHPRASLSEVRLVSGSRLIASAPIDVERPDVAAHLGRSGRFGFRIELADSRPDPLPGEPLQFLALSADGSCRYVLRLPGAGAASTEARLRAALAPELRGLRGHFDGLSADGRELQGWCYGHHGGVATIWLQAEGLPPRALRCTGHRPGMEAQGHVDHCGFMLPLHDWPEAAGRAVWASFDEAGNLRLPQTAPVRLPEAVDSAPMAVAPQPAAMEALVPNVVEAPPLAEVPVEFQAHWQALEDFRELIDRLELQVQQAEQSAYKEVLSSSPGPKPLERSRSARFRLWR